MELNNYAIHYSKVTGLYNMLKLFGVISTGNANFHNTVSCFTPLGKM